MTQDYLKKSYSENRATLKSITDYNDEQLNELNIKTNSESDKNQIIYILNKCLNYPSTYLAQNHRKANRLGQNDRRNGPIINQQPQVRIEKSICRCCGFLIQQQDITVGSTYFEDLSFGASNIVFFKTIINIALLLSIMLCVYSGYSLVSNILVADKLSQYASSFLILSLGAKNPPTGYRQDLFLISSWLGVLFIFIWGIMFAQMNYNIKLIQKKQGTESSVSQFSVAIERMPYGLTQEQVQEQINSYFDRIIDQNKESISQLKIQKYNQGKPFYFNQSEFSDQKLIQIHTKRKQLKQEFISWIIERQNQNDFSTTKQYRREKKQQFQKNENQIKEKYEAIKARIKSKLQQSNRQTKTTVFITFESVRQRNFFLKHNENNILNSIRAFLPGLSNENRLVIKNKQKRQFLSIIVESAPQPEDINWGNIGVTRWETFYRKIFTFFATTLMLGISLVIVYGLSKIQANNQNNKLVSVLISLALPFSNFLIIKVIQYTTVYERDYTTNNFQVSLAVKSIIAQLVNLICVPLIVNYWIKNNQIYGQNSLSQNIFILSITSSFIPPLTRLFDPYHMYLRITKWLQYQPKRKLALNQYELNNIAQKMQFQVGFQYIYLMSNFIFTCYYVSLQPIIPVFAILGLFFMYWVQKYILFKRSQRPIPGTDKISRMMYQIIYFGASAYTLGSFTWSTFLLGSQYRSSLVANLTAGALSLFLFLFPYNIIIEACTKREIDFPQQQQTYRSRRIFFSSEYDRMNPNTSQEGVKQYKIFLLEKKKQIDKMSRKQKDQLFELLIRNTQNNVHKKGYQFPSSEIFGNMESLAIQNIFQNESKNITIPLTIASVLMPEIGQLITSQYKSPNTQVRVGSSIKQYYEDTSKALHHNLSENVAASEMNYQLSNAAVALSGNYFNNPYASKINFDQFVVSSQIREMEPNNNKNNPQP